MQVCNWELEHMLKHNKKIIPVVVKDDFEWDDVHKDVAALNFVFFSRPTDVFDEVLSTPSPTVRLLP